MLSVLLATGCDKAEQGGSSSGKPEAAKRAASDGAGDSGEKENTVAAREGKSQERVPRSRKPPLATLAEGQSGKVISPFSDEVVDVSGHSPGDIVEDPKFPGDESKRFEVPELTKSIPEAKIVPGKPGFVFSPYNSKVIDVTGLKPGTLVADPTFPTSEKKHFRIPAGAVTDSGGGLLPENIDGLPIRTGPDGSLSDPP